MDENSWDVFYKMKPAILITLIVSVSMVYAIVWYPTLIQVKWAFGILLAFLTFCWLSWAMYQIRFRKWYKHWLRFHWYNKMGLLESAWILEPEYATKYWGSLISGFLK